MTMMITKGKILVTLQFIFLAWIVVSGPIEPVWPWIALWVMGIGLGVWAGATMRRSSQLSVTPEPMQRTRLLTNGPYRYIRHPMYLALLLLGIAYLFDLTSWGHLLGLLGLFIVLMVKMSYEERLLSTQLSGYREYKMTTKRLVPGIY